MPHKALIRLHFKEFLLNHSGNYHGYLSLFHYCQIAHKLSAFLKKMIPCLEFVVRNILICNSILICKLMVLCRFIRSAPEVIVLDEGIEEFEREVNLVYEQ